MNEKYRILVVEDEPNIASFICAILTAYLYEVTVAPTARDALQQAVSFRPDLILLDLGLPDADGTSVIQSVRTYTQTPIIVVSARDQEREKVEALDYGADDYITKPFGTSELLARVRSALRRVTQTARPDSPSHTFYQSGGLKIDFEKRQVLLNGREVHLTQIEYKLVTLLAQSPGRVITYDSLITSIWGPYAKGDNQILRVNMANIRRKLEEDTAQPRYLLTEMGVGYRMAEESAVQSVSF